MAYSTKKVGGAPCLDFVNTVSSWEPVAAGRFVPAQDRLSTDPLYSGATLARARSFRTALYQLFRAAIEGRKPFTEDLALLDREFRRARSADRLVADRDGFRVTPENGETPLGLVARSAVELLTSPDRLLRVRACPGEDCGWLFLDSSRGGRRRWCDMSDCGNVDKVRRFRDRQGAASERR